MTSPSALPQVAWAHPLIFYLVAWPIARMPLALAPRLYMITMFNYEVAPLPSAPAPSLSPLPPLSFLPLVGPV